MFLTIESTPMSNKHQFFGITRGFARLDAKTKYVCHSLISTHAKFCNNLTMKTMKLLVKICCWGEEKVAIIIIGVAIRYWVL